MYFLLSYIIVVKDEREIGHVYINDNMKYVISAKFIKGFLENSMQ